MKLATTDMASIERKLDSIKLTESQIYGTLDSEQPSRIDKRYR
jgi:hypothetical protein